MTCMVFKTSVSMEHAVQHPIVKPCYVSLGFVLNLFVCVCVPRICKQVINTQNYRSEFGTSEESAHHRTQARQILARKTKDTGFAVIVWNPEESNGVKFDAMLKAKRSSQEKSLYDAWSKWVMLGGEWVSSPALTTFVGPGAAEATYVSPGVRAGILQKLHGGFGEDRVGSCSHSHTCIMISCNDLGSLILLIKAAT